MDENLPRKLSTDDVAIGGAGHLFLHNGAHHVYQIASGQRPPLAAAFATFRRNILGRHATVTANGAQYLHIIFPDKQSVLNRHYVIPNPVCLGEQHLLASPEVADFVYYPLQELRQDTGDVFFHTDTHLCDRGNILVASNLATLLTGEDQTVSLASLLSCLSHAAEYSGDLGARFNPPISHLEQFIRIAWPLAVYSNGLTGGNNGTADIIFSPQARYRKRVLLVGDSFLRGSMRFLSYFFTELLFLRSPYFHEEVFLAMKPDVVVTANVERYLYACLADEKRGAFCMIPHVNELAYAPSKEFAEAFSAVLSYPRTPYQTFVDKIFSS